MGKKRQFEAVEKTVYGWESMVKRIRDIRRQKNEIIVFVEGNIGSGKTTLINNLKQRLKTTSEIYIIKENVEKCEFFKDYVKDIKTYGFEFQKWILDNKIKQVDKIKMTPMVKKNRFIIFDRSTISDSQIFYQNIRNKGFISDRQHKEYCSLLNKANIYVQPDITIFMDTKPVECMSRIHKRSRGGEEFYDIETIRNFHQLYKKVFANVKKLIVVNGNMNSEKINNFLVKIK